MAYRNKTCTITLLFIILIMVIPVYSKPSKGLPHPGKVYILHLMHIEPLTPQNRNQFDEIVSGLDKLFTIAESYGQKITIQSEMKFPLTAPVYGVADFKLAEQRGHEFATHTHNYGDRCGYDRGSTRAEIYDAMYSYMEQRKKAMDTMVDCNETICTGKFAEKNIKFSRRAALASHQVSWDLGYKLNMGLFVDFYQDIKKWSVPHRLSYNDMSIEDTSSPIIFVSGNKDMANMTKYPDNKGGKFAKANFIILKGIFAQVYSEFQKDPSKDYVFVDAFHCWATLANPTQKAAGLRNYNEYLSYFEPYITGGEVESVTARKFASIILRKRKE